MDWLMRWLFFPYVVIITHWKIALGIFACMYFISRRIVKGFLKGDLYITGNIYSLFLSFVFTVLIFSLWAMFIDWH